MKARYFKEAVKTESQKIVQVLVDRDARYATVKVPGMVPMAVPVEEFNDLAVRTWGPRYRMNRIDDRVRLLLVDLAPLFYALGRSRIELSTIDGPDYDVRFSTPDDWMRYVLRYVEEGGMSGEKE